MLSLDGGQPCLRPIPHDLKSVVVDVEVQQRLFVTGDVLAIGVGCEVSRYYQTFWLR